MWQKTVLLDKEYFDYSDNLVSEFSAVDNLTFAEFETRGKIVYNLAADEQNRLQVKADVDDVLADFLLESMKFDYLVKRMGSKPQSPPAAAVLAAMLYFDVTGEREEAARLLTAMRDLSLDGVFNFSMGKIKRNWEEVVSLSKNILSVSSDSQDLLSVAGFISASGEEGGASLLVYSIGNDNYLKNLTLKIDVTVPKLYENAELNLVTAVVKQHPNRIILQTDSLSEAAKNALGGLAAVKKANI